MICAAPKRDAPAALQLPENCAPGSQEPVMDVIRTSQFSWLDENHPTFMPVSTEQQNPFFTPDPGIHQTLKSINNEENELSTVNTVIRF